MQRKTATSKFVKLQEYLVDLSDRMGDEDDLGAILSDGDRAEVAKLGNDAENWQTEQLEGLRGAVDAILEQYKGDDDL